jgi:hypothetical protein
MITKNIKKTLHNLRNKILKSKIYFSIKTCFNPILENDYYNYNYNYNYNYDLNDNLNTNQVIINIFNQQSIINNYYNRYYINYKIIGETSENYPDLHQFLIKDLFIRIQHQETYFHIYKYYNHLKKNISFQNNININFNSNLNSDCFAIKPAGSLILNEINNIILELLDTKFDNNNSNFTLSNIIYRLYKHDVTRFSTYNLSLVYLDKLFLQYYNYIKLTNLNTFIIYFIICLLIASKYNDDQPYNNYSYSVISYIPLNIVNKLEILILQLFDYNLSYTIQEIKYIKDIIQ